MSAAPASTCTLALTRTLRTRPATGARIGISVFIASSTAIRSPAATRSPGATAIASTIDGAGARTTPPSSRASVWGTPSTSTRCVSPSTTDTTRCRRRSQGEPALEASDALDREVDRTALDDHPVAGRAETATSIVCVVPRIRSLMRWPISGRTRGPTPRRRGEEAAQLDGRLGLVGLDRGSQQRHLAAAAWQCARRLRSADRASRCRTRRGRPRPGRAGRAGTPGWWCPRAPRRSSRPGHGASARAPRRGRARAR